MKKLRFLLFMLCLPVIAQAKPPKGKLKITHLTDNFYVYVSYGEFQGKEIPANAMYLVTKDGVILFDTPWDESYYQPLLDSIWARHHKNVIMCISTHFHTDRTGGLKYYGAKGIKTYTTAMTDSLCIIHNDNRAKYRIPDDSVFHIGGYTFETYYGGPGHAPDNIVIWFPKQKILYGGCLIKSTDEKDLGNLSDANVGEWDKSIKNIQHKFVNPTFVIPGHNSWQNIHSPEHTLMLITQYKKNHPEKHS